MEDEDVLDIEAINDVDSAGADLVGALFFEFSRRLSLRTTITATLTAPDGTSRPLNVIGEEDYKAVVDGIVAPTPTQATTQNWNIRIQVTGAITATYNFVLSFRYNATRREWHPRELMTGTTTGRIRFDSYEGQGVLTYMHFSI